MIAKLYYGKEITHELHQEAANLLFDCFTRNAGTYIKLGQMVGQLEMLVPDEYVQVFESMCQHAPKTDFQDVKAILEQDFKAKMEDVYSYFSETPVGSASLA